MNLSPVLAAANLHFEATKICKYSIQVVEATAINTVKTENIPSRRRLKMTLSNKQTDKQTDKKKLSKNFFTLAISALNGRYK